MSFTELLAIALVLYLKSLDLVLTKIVGTDSASLAGLV